MATPSPVFKFGDFAWICSRASLPLCPALGLGDPQCYSRNIGVKNFLLFQPSVMAVDFAAILMTLIMIIHIKSKYTAVGRKEMVVFFYLYLACVVLDFLLVTNIIAISSSLYKYVAAAQIAFMTSALGILLMNGFVGFQWTEDGTRISVWSFRITAVALAGVGFIMSLATFVGFAGMSIRQTMPLFILYFIFSGACLFLYTALQVFLVLNTMNDLWPIGDLLLGLLFLAIGVLSSIGFSNQICKFAVHYVDGMFIGAIFVLLAVMMVYKYWDSITTEDLEFAVNGGSQVWHYQNTMDLPSKLTDKDS